MKNVEVSFIIGFSMAAALLLGLGRDSILDHRSDQSGLSGQDTENGSSPLLFQLTDEGCKLLAGTSQVENRDEGGLENGVKLSNPRTGTSSRIAIDIQSGGVSIDGEDKAKSDQEVLKDHCTNRA